MNVACCQKYFSAKLRGHQDQYRAFCKVFYEDAFIQGLEECFANSPDLDDAIDFHEMEAGRIRARLVQYLNFQFSH